MARKKTDTINKMTAMRDKFVANLSDRLKAIEHELDGLTADLEPNEILRCLEKLLGLAHKLRGAAGTFDLPNITQAAGLFEDLCKKLISTTEPFDAADRSALAQLYLELSVMSDDGGNGTFLDAVSWESLASKQDQNDKSSSTIILVDDDASFVEILQNQLVHFGFSVVNLADHAKLEDAIEKINPAAVIMDVAFPGDADAGVKTVKSLRDRGLITCPVVFLSVRGDFQARLSAVRAGCDGYQVKPVDIVELVELMSRLTKQVLEDSYRIVIIDDDPDVSEFYATLLSEAGMESAQINDPMKVMGPLRELRPDVILMDISMPSCNGFELAKVIRQDRSYVQIPIVFLTGSEIDDAWLKAMQSGADEFLHKDINPKELVASVRARARRSRDLNLTINRLSESELRFRAVSESAREAIVTTDQSGRIIYWNKGAKNKFGYESAEILGKSIDVLFPNRFTDDLNNGYKDAASNKNLKLDGATFEASGVRKNGDEFFIEMSLANWQINDKTYFTSIIRDISERKATEEDRDRLLNAVETSGEGMILFDRHDRFIYANKKYKDLYPSEIPDLTPGTSFRDIIKRCAYEGIVESAIGREDEWIEERVSKHLSLSNADEQKTSSGKWVRIGEYRTEDGGIFGVRTDITDLKDAREEAENANLAKSEFLSSMSHELRTPMNSIIGFGQMLETNDREPLTLTQDKCVSHIMRSGKHLLRLINEILDLAMIESGSIDLEMEPLFPCEIFKDCLELLKNSAAEQGITFSGKKQSDDGIIIDRFRFKQVLINLLTNAIKYNNEGGHVTYGCVDKPNGIVRIFVTDTGNGIPEGSITDVFMPFERLQNKKSDIEGTGIGLTISKRLVEAMGGEIGCDSIVGEGSTFWIDFPQAAEMPKLSASVSSPQIQKADAAKSKEVAGMLLYVEDDKHNTELMELILTRINNLSMISAHTGELGVELAKSEQPELIIMDIGLPGIDGFEALERLQNDHKTKDIPVIGLSANAMAHDIERAMKSGFKKYLTKPIDIEEVTETIRELIAEKSP